MITWSDNPGCFERHLQRKYLYPFLFPNEVRSITLQDVAAARTQDSEEFATLMNDAKPLLDLDKRATVTIGETQEHILQIGTLERRAAEIGAKAEHFGKALKELRLTINSLQTNALTELGEPISEINAEKMAVMNLQTQSFLAQAGRTDTPIKDSEVTASLLTEKPTNIYSYIALMELYDPEWVLECRAEALKVVVESINDGHLIEDVRAKLSALGIRWSKVILCLYFKRIISLMKRTIKNTR